MLGFPLSWLHSWVGFDPSKYRLYLPALKTPSKRKWAFLKSFSNIPRDDFQWATWVKSWSINQSLGQGLGGLQLARIRTVCQSLEPKGVVGADPPTPVRLSYLLWEWWSGSSQMKTVILLPEKWARNSGQAKPHRCPYWTLFFSRIPFKLTP